MKTFVNAKRTVALSISTSGNNTVISAPTTGFIVIDHIDLMPTSAVSIIIKDGSSTELTGTYPLDAKQGFTQENTLGFEDGLYTISTGNNFVINLSDNVAVNGYITYRILGEN